MESGGWGVEGGGWRGRVAPECGYISNKVSR